MNNAETLKALIQNQLDSVYACSGSSRYLVEIKETNFFTGAIKWKKQIIRPFQTQIPFTNIFTDKQKVQLVKCLLYQPRDLVSNPRTHINIQGLVILAQGRQRQVDSWNSFIGQPA